MLRKRHISPFAEEVLGVFPAVVIEGARQVGKSTLAAQLAEGRDATVLTLDDPELRNSALTDATSFVAQGRDGLLVIDEVQRAPELVLAIKAAIDRDRRPGRFLLTGSSDLLRMPGASDSLAGRAVTLSLNGFSQGELGQRFDDFIANIASRAPELVGFETEVTREDIAQRITVGGYPEAQAVATKTRNLWFDTYVSRLLIRDAQDLRRVDPRRLDTLLRLVAANQSGELVKSRLAHDASIPETSISSSLDLLQTIFLVDALRPWTPNLTSREVGRPKAFVSDPGLAARLARLTAPQLVAPAGATHLGPQFEGFVTTELRKQAQWSTSPHELFHFRDRAGLEVDLVAELEDGGIVAIEVKSAAGAKQAHFAGLERLRDRLGDRFLAGLVVNTSQRALPFGDRLWSVPVAALWEW